ncbi:MAG: hypothetical protein ACW99A_24000 [Candidatus Kariarchaeaceae archaeon]|jgi:hypothetical protein
MKHIYKYSLENTFFQLITSENEITKADIEGQPAIVWQENENTVTSWSYEDEEQRDNDFEVVNQFRIRP